MGAAFRRPIAGVARGPRHGSEACGLLREPLLDGTGDGCDGQRSAGRGNRRIRTRLKPRWSPAPSRRLTGSPSVPLERGREAPTSPPVGLAVARERLRHDPRATVGDGMSSPEGPSAHGTRQSWTPGEAIHRREFGTRDPWPRNQRSRCDRGCDSRSNQRLLTSAPAEHERRPVSGVRRRTSQAKTCLPDGSDKRRRT